MSVVIFGRGVQAQPQNVQRIRCQRPHRLSHIKSPTIKIQSCLCGFQGKSGKQGAQQLKGRTFQKHPRWQQTEKHSSSLRQAKILRKIVLRPDARYRKIARLVAIWMQPTPQYSLNIKTLISAFTAQLGGAYWGWTIRNFLIRFRGGWSKLSNPHKKQHKDLASVVRQRINGGFLI